jgi:hypothetical protein
VIMATRATAWREKGESGEREKRKEISEERERMIIVAS